MDRERILGANPTKCSVTDGNGNHCPGNAIYPLVKEQETLFLCGKCFKSYRNGEWQIKKERCEVEEELSKLKREHPSYWGK